MFINPLEPEQNGHRFPGNIVKCIFSNKNVSISNNISLKFVPRGPLYNALSLGQIIAWCQPGESEAMMILFTDAYMRHSASMG